MFQSAAASKPPETFSHSRTTVPLNLSFGGVRTTTRVLNSAVSPGETYHVPSDVRGALEV